MRIADIHFNDAVNGIDFSVSLWVQGCPHHCSGCHNPETWSFSGGYEAPANLVETITKTISANGVTRNFSILGGEPLCPENREDVLNIIKQVREAYPQIKILVWTGYTLMELTEECPAYLSQLFHYIDTLIDGRYEEENRDITLKLRGSSNQKIIDIIKK